MGNEFQKKYLHSRRPLAKVTIVRAEQFTSATLYRYDVMGMQFVFFFF